MKKIYTLSLLTFLFTIGSFAQPVYQWAKLSTGTAVPLPNSTAADASGNMYVIGDLQNSADLDPGPGTATLTSNGSHDIFVAKYDANGNYLWAFSFGTTGFDEGNDITVDPSGNIIIVGHLDYTGCDIDPGPGVTTLSHAIFTAKYSSAGALIWGFGIAGYAASIGSTIASDAAGNIYIAGRFQGYNVDFDPGPLVYPVSYYGNTNDIFVAKYTGAGAFQWAFVSGSMPANDYANAIAVDPAGNVSVTGLVNSNTCFLYHYNTSGVLQWGYLIYGSTEGHGVAMDVAGNTYVTGDAATTIDLDPGAGVVNYVPVTGGDAFVCKYNSAGAYVWGWGITGSSGANIHAIEVNSSSEVYLTGVFSGNIDFDPTAATANLTSANNDMYITKYDNSGNYQWAVNFSASSSAYYTSSIALSTSGNLYLSGIIIGTSDFDPGAGAANLTGPGMIMAKYAPCALAPSQPGTINGPVQLCLNTTNTYSIPAIAGATSYTWSLPAGWTGTSSTNTISATAGTAGGTITVTANNACGSSTAQSLAVTVSNPVLNVTPVNASCNGMCDGSITAIASGGIAPYSYSPSLTNLCAATYTVTATDNIGCITTQSAVVAQPTAISVTGAANPGTICSGNCSTLSAGAISGGTPPYTFNWQPGNLTGSPVTVCPTTTSCYTLTVTDAGGCTASVLVCVNVNPAPNIVATGGGIVCEGSNVCFGSTGGLTYSWSGPCGFNSTQQNPCITPITSGCGGNFTVTGVDVNGCSGTATVAIAVNPIPAVTYNETQTITCVNWGPVTLAAGTPAGGTYSGTAVTGNTFAPATAGVGTYNVVYTYTNGNGCSNSDTSQITVSLCSGIQTVSGPTELQFFPNPFSDVITIQCGDSYLNTELKIYDVFGQEIYSSRIVQQKTDIDLGKFANGVYFVKIVGPDGTSTKQIIKN